LYFISRLLDELETARWATGVVFTKEEGAKAATVAAMVETVKRVNFILS